MSKSKEGISCPHYPPLCAPTYATDLGVRQITDPKTFYEEYLRLAQLPPIEKELVFDHFQKRDILSFSNDIDGYILFFGNYTIASSIILRQRKDLLKYGSYDTLIKCGVILAAISNYYALMAVKEFTLIGALTSLDTAGKILVSSLYKNGQTQLSSEINKIRILDPLGIHMSRAIKMRKIEEVCF
ncbi:hypothetical protein [Schaalia sp. lx-260]|uniref:hypothetical protein n=1 Tax=Schaalia sp. lx-260 TaxID=2899082 RepID=UPI001E41A6EA|nr:hypothetical protein [Schaalia sp. lx-260]MCD4549219.1 hypothetical protein [Schaalia sp. lx-260]